MRLDPRTRRDILEGAIVAVAIEVVRESLKDARVTVDADAPRFIVARRVLLGRSLHVIDDEQIEPAVIVVVELGPGDAELAVGDARGARHVGEPSVAAIVQQLIPTRAGDEEIHVAVVVEVGGGGPDRVANA